MGKFLKSGALMRRREFLKKTINSSVVMPLALSYCGKKRTTDVKPNIVFLMADDLGYGDLGCYGQQLLNTPNIDKIAESGLRFTNAYAGGPVCTPSRSVLMTGQHNGHTAARDNIPHYHTYLQDTDVTVATVLKQAGYRCGGVGKWSLGDAGTVGRATNQGFDMWFGYLNQDHAHYYYPEYLDDNDARLELTGNTETRQIYSHDLLTERALQFIQESKDKPFFFYGAFTLPHFASKKEDVDGLTVPTTEPYSDKPWDERSKKYASMVHMLDRDVGRILDRLDELKIADNTLLIFTSDNGGHSTVWEEFDTNGPLQGYKRNLTEGGIRVPFLAKWPGNIPAGETTDEIVAFQDMLPTIAEIVGINPPAKIDGISVLDALRGNKLANPHNYLYWDYGHCRDRYDQAVRMGKWKGIREGVGNRIQLYDLDKDIAEKNDLAQKLPDIVHEISDIMKNAVTPSERYTIGKKYTGRPIWQRG
jgi:arylsulfatase A-like enzyme